MLSSSNEQPQEDMMMKQRTYTPWELQWRSTDFDGVAQLQSWLEQHGLTADHDEPDPESAAMYLHEAYEAFACSSCGRPTLRAAGNQLFTQCGRAACSS
jgi:O-methyltransferase involved in polyketide biosynthesis